MFFHLDSFRKIPILVLAFLLCSAAAGFGQQVIKIQPHSKPFEIGEKLVYEGKASKIIGGISVADLTFILGKAPDSENYLVKTEALSKGTLLKLFRYSFAQNYESLIDHDTFRILKTTKHDVQKERIRDSVADFDYQKKSVTFVENDPKNPNRPPKRIASDLPGTTNDIVSAIYMMRTIPLTVGKSFDLSLSDSGLVYTIPVAVTARELQRTDIGRVWCYRVEPAIFGPGRFIEQKGQIIIWITEDARHLPVRGHIETESFKVEVRIKSVTNSK